MTAVTRVFYLFSSTHSLLLGLIALFTPLILWKSGASLAFISFFVALSGISFSIALIYWDKLRAKLAWSSIFAFSFVFEILLAIIILFARQWILLSVGAVLTGFTGCFYWSTQRIIFVNITKDKNTGNTFGNFQLLVAISLKLGILIGGYLLQVNNLKTLFSVALLISAVGYYLTNKTFNQKLHLNNSDQAITISLTRALRFKDNFNSRSIFFVDGILLFIESYFWMISLYILIGENIAKLGSIIVMMGVALGMSFIYIKKQIDHVNSQCIFHIAVAGYIISWLLRSNLRINEDPFLFYMTLLIITFLTQFFRLAFNKRFYQIARLARPTEYIVCKSYISQFLIAIFFSIFGLLLMIGKSPMYPLHLLYIIIVPLACVYFLYKDPNSCDPH